MLQRSSPANTGRPWELFRAKIRAIEEHATACPTCERALMTAPVGRFSYCLAGDQLVAEVYRDIYARHRLMVKARQEYYGTRRDPLAMPVRMGEIDPTRPRRPYVPPHRMDRRT